MTLNPHVAGDRVISVAHGQTYQPCVFCGKALISVPTDDVEAELQYLATGECAGAGCPVAPLCAKEASA